MRKKAAVISIALIGFLVFAYSIPFIYTGNYTAIPQDPVPAWSKIYGSLTCILWLHLQNQESGSLFGHTPPAFNPPQWTLLGVLYSDGHYYLQCDPYRLPVG
jgi:hypothetical protein